MSNTNDDYSEATDLLARIIGWIILVCFTAWALHGYLVSWGWLNPEQINWLEFLWVIFLTRIALAARMFPE